MSVARRLSAQDSRIRFVVTTRDHVQGEWLNWLPRIQISKLSAEQADELAAKILVDSEQFAEFQRQLILSSSLQPLMQVPLLNTLIVAVFKNLKKLPENKTRLYEMFVELSCGGWDFAKDVHRPTQFGQAIKITLLSRLAGQLHMNDQRDCTEVEIRTAMNSVMPLNITRFPEMLAELVEDGLIVKSGNTYYFSHLSFQEYLASKDLSDPTGRRPSQVLEWFLLGNGWWKEVLLFYISGTPPRDSELWIRKTADSFVSARPESYTDIATKFAFLMEYLTTVFSGYRPETTSLPRRHRRKPNY
jgi:predicted NACHT family NTPase